MLCDATERKFHILDLLCCPECGGRLNVLSFIDPPQRQVIEKILLQLAVLPCYLNMLCGKANYYQLSKELEA